MHLGRMFISLFIGFDLTWLSSLIGFGCKPVPPGGIGEGWYGLPVPFNYCGAWGDSTNWLLVAIDFLFWTVVVYFLIKDKTFPRIQSGLMALLGSLLMLSALPYYLLFGENIAQFFSYIIIILVPTSLVLGLYTLFSNFRKGLIVGVILITLMNLLLLTNSLFGIGP